MALRATFPTYTPEEYLEFERAAEFRSEYIDGEIVAMSGGSRQHSLIAMNIGGELRFALRNGNCEVHGSDLRVHVDEGGLYTYPDVTIVCGEPELEDEERDTLLNPVVIVEVLSPSTEAYDRGEKFTRYRLLPSLREYVLVSQHRPRVERFTLRDGEWFFSAVNGLDAELALESVGCKVPLAELYAKVVFDSAPTAATERTRGE